jgi:ABC-type nitrate/sulfonate/bicarbonate transport system substrate-binding protein
MVTLRRRSWLIIAVILLVIVTVLSSFAYLNYQPSINGKQNVAISIFPNELETPIFVAQDQHFFDKNGINLTITYYSSTPAALTSVSNHNVDITTASDFAFAANEPSQEKNLTILASMVKTESSFMVARKDKGIENPIDLYGKRVGLTLNIAPEFYFGRFLDLQGLDKQKVITVNLPLAQYVEAITNGTVDAIVGQRSIVDQIQAQLGNNTVVWPVQSNQPAYILLVSRGDWATQHPDTVTRFLKSISQAEDYYQTHQKSAQAIVDKQINRTVSQESWLENSFSLSLDQSLIVAMQDETLWRINNNLTNENSFPNFSDYIFVSGLKSVKPEAVNIIG